jgi:hypothetical protein
MYAHRKDKIVWDKFIMKAIYPFSLLLPFFFIEEHLAISAPNTFFF